MMEADPSDICRVCRSEGTSDRPLFHPCVCTGSIKFIHQECLVQWLKYSRKEYCELCKHRFAFTPIYSPDMPKRLPIKDIVSGLLASVGKAVRYWFHYTLVAIAWLGIVPLTACRIYRSLFTGSVSSLLTLPLDMLSTDNLLSDCFQGCFVVTCTLCAFISLVWLREQILHGGGPDWLEDDIQPVVVNQQPNVAGGDNGGVADNNGGVAAQNGAVDGPPGQQEDAGDAAGAEENPAGGAADEEAGENNADAANNGNNAAQDDNNWNPIEWDRAAEELTWERLLGLDGSLVFLEHVFWVVSLNTLFILVFAFCPYHIGHFLIAGLKLDELISASQFEGAVTTLIGYGVFAVSLIVLHGLARLARFPKSRRILGLCYVVVKVSLLVVVEIGIFPLICGWWLDICSLTMFDASLKDRETSFKSAPGTSMFIHWLVGMIYVFYFASFILLLREVLRPGVLWFLRNLNDPEFHPIQEMIHQPVVRHVRRFLASIVIFGSTVLVMLWLPIRIIKKVIPGFLPYNVVLSSDAPVSELSLELLLLQVVLPALLEQGHTRLWLKGLVRGWVVVMAFVLHMRSYLLGDVDINEEDNIIRYGNAPEVAAPAAAAAQPAQQAAGLGAAHQAMLQGGGPTGFQPYKRPRGFYFRLLVLFAVMCFTLFLFSLVLLISPVFIGRKLMSLRMGDAKIHELYTSACGLYVCWLGMRVCNVMTHWIPQGWGAILHKLQEWVVMVIKAVLIGSILIGLVPLLLGLLFELVIVVPLRVPLDQSPVFFPWQNWALGVLHAKIICAVTMMGPQWWLKRATEEVYNNGLRNLNLTFIMTHLCLPIVGALGMALAVPYVIGKTIIPAFGVDEELQMMVLRRIYPFLLTVLVLVGICVFQARQFKRLYEHIKNDKYLVGQRLVNYQRNRQQQQASARSQTSDTQ
ncbi:E3 ubiquitin-protein ligase MARCHF6-like [Lineus longissimus]|uniref:E3 ubiquitin-protein ligase MARCHF6-like n=1 Tax=Lineus longissimus TaxID=88925 RepID=UPI002B4DC85A